jgi:type II secretory pathway component PulF
MTRAPETGRMTLDELLALNEEIAALVRAGVPLEQGLAAVGSDMPGRLGPIASMLAERLERGEPLLQVLADQSVRLPPVYRAVLEAGLRAGRLPAAMECLAASLRRLADARRAILAAAMYPLLVVVLACGLFAFFCRQIAPRLLTTLHTFSAPGQGPLAFLASLGTSAGLWGLLIPAVLVGLAALWWYQSRRAVMLQPGWSRLCFAWIPWLGRPLRTARAATFAEVLSLLMENRVPLPEGIVLAAEACGDRQLVPAARRFSEALQRGELPAADGAHIPPLLRWLMAANQRPDTLLPAMHGAAATYRRLAQYQTDVARLLLPMLLTVVIGGGVTLFYAASLFLPYTSLLRTLGGGI